MIFSTNGFFNEGLLDDYAVDDNGVSILSQHDLCRWNVLWKLEPQSLFDVFPKTIRDPRSTIAGRLNSPGCRDTEMIEHSAHDPTVPKDGLHREVVDAERLAKVGVGDRLEEGKLDHLVLAEEGYQHVTSRPVLYVYRGKFISKMKLWDESRTFVEYDFIAKNFDLDERATALDKAGQYLLHGS